MRYLIITTLLGLVGFGCLSSAHADVYIGSDYLSEHVRLASTKVAVDDIKAVSPNEELPKEINRAQTIKLHNKHINKIAVVKSISGNPENSSPKQGKPIGAKPSVSSSVAEKTAVPKMLAKPKGVKFAAHTSVGDKTSVKTQAKPIDAKPTMVSSIDDKKGVVTKPDATVNPNLKSHKPRLKIHHPMHHSNIPASKNHFPAVMQVNIENGSLRDIIEQIARNAGWRDVVWNVPNDYNYIGNQTIAANNLAGVMEKLLRPYPVQAVFYTGNHVLVIIPRNA